MPRSSGRGPFAARAVEMTFIGYTNGCFGAGCVPVNTSAYQSALLTGGSLSLLLYQNAAINTTVAKTQTILF